MTNYNEQPFELPSQGEAYDDLIPGSIKIRPFEAGDHRIMAGAGDAVELYRLLLAKIVTEPRGADFEIMLMGDITAILVMSRILTLGGDYEVKFVCSGCDERQKANMALEKLVSQMADDEEFVAMGGFKHSDIEITVNGVIYTCHLNRLADEDVIQKVIRAQKRQGKIHKEEVDRLYFRLAQLIDAIDGKTEPSITKKVDMLGKLHPDHFDDLLEQLNKRDVGVLASQYVQCKTCGEENKVRMEFDAEFFRAISRRKGDDRVDAV